MKRSVRLALLAVAVAGAGSAGVLAGCTMQTQPATGPARTRPANWATPIDKPRLKNLYKVSDDLYRGAEPTAEGCKQLEAMGIKTVISLQSFETDRDEIKGTKLGYEQIRMNAWHAEDQDMVAFLKIVSDKSKAPFFVHCQYGSDRTGTVCAIYRMAIQGWSKDEAIKEMTEGGFGFHGIYQNLVNYLKKVDIDKLKRQAGIKDSPTSAPATEPAGTIAR